MHPRQANILNDANELREKLAAKTDPKPGGPAILWKYTDPEGRVFYLEERLTSIKSPYNGKTFAAKPKRFTPAQVGQEMREEGQEAKKAPKAPKAPKGPKTAADWAVTALDSRSEGKFDRLNREGEKMAKAIASSVEDYQYVLEQLSEIPALPPAVISTAKEAMKEAGKDLSRWKGLMGSYFPLMDRQLEKGESKDPDLSQMNRNHIMVAKKDPWAASTTKTAEDWVSDGSPEENESEGLDTKEWESFQAKHERITVSISQDIEQYYFLMENVQDYKFAPPKVKAFAKKCEDMGRKEEKVWKDTFDDFKVMESLFEESHKE